MVLRKGSIARQETDLQLVVNAINATEAGLINAYCTQIIVGLQQPDKGRVVWTG